jgi:PAS domain S-box-containing protein
MKRMRLFGGDGQSEALHGDDGFDVGSVNESLLQENQKLTRQLQEVTNRLKESENRLRLALEGANEGLWVTDLIGGKMYFNPRSADIVGYSLHELGDTTEFWDMKLIHPDDWPMVEKSLIDHFEGKTPYHEVEYQARTKWGEWKWILEHGRVTRRDENGNPIQIIGTHLDITERKEKEVKLQESEEKFRSLAENAPFGIALLTTDNSIEYANLKFGEIFGYTTAEIPSLSHWFQKVFPNVSHRMKMMEEWEKLYCEKKEGRDIRSITTRIVSKSEEEKIVYMKPVKLKKGKCFLTFQEISARVKAEEELQRRKGELELKTKELEEVNTALRVLLKRRENDKIEIEEKVLYNVKDLVMPYLEKLMNGSLDNEQRLYLRMLTTNLNEIISPFPRRLALNPINLTPTEIQVANLVKEGKITKEIASIMRVSKSAIDFHRYNIRKKLDLVSKKINLRSYLQSI